MKALEKLGISIFLICFATFVVSIGLGSYELSSSKIEETLGIGPKAEYFEKAGAELISQSYGSQFSFVADVAVTAKKASELAIADHGFSQAQLDQIASNSLVDGQVQYSEQVLNSSISNPDLAQKVKDNTSWMFGREYGSIDDFRNDLNSKQSDINNAVLSKYGFPEQSIKDLKLQMTKAATSGVIADNKDWFAIFCFIGSVLGAFLFILPQLRLIPGIKNHHVQQHSATNVGWIGIMVCIFMISFYALLYWFPEYMTQWIIMVDPVAQIVTGGNASRWFLYGFMYTIAILTMGTRMIIKYRHNKYQITRTFSVMFFQTAFAFLIPEILVQLNQPYADLKNMWPLDYDFFFNGNLLNYDGVQQAGMASVNGGSVGLAMLMWGIALFAIGVPVITYFYGKRWYCSWVCGCGGLAETLGDPYRQLSDKGVKAWKIERWLIHGVLVFAVLMTALTLYTFFSGNWSLWGIETGSIQKTYGFMIGAAFSGVVGTGFYPFMGNRVWCRFGCPLAAYLGLVQRFKSRFRITTNGGQCISCGNCSEYCEMGIDVRWYAQRGQNIVRSSCVGCGVCAAVCPRGVLKLENGAEEGRLNTNPILIGNDGIKFNPAMK